MSVVNICLHFYHLECTIASYWIWHFHADSLSLICSFRELQSLPPQADFSPKLKLPRSPVDSEPWGLTRLTKMGALQRVSHVVLVKGMTSFHSTSKTTNPSPWSEMGMRKPQTSWKNMCYTFPAKCPNKCPAAEIHKTTKARLFIPTLHTGLKLLLEHVIDRIFTTFVEIKKKQKNIVFKVLSQVSMCLVS